MRSPEVGRPEDGRQAGFVRRTLLFVVFALVVTSVAQAQLQRIVSTSPSITEVLFALGLGPRVVGVSNYCEYPSSVLSLPKVGTFLHPDPELIARLQPDLVIVHKLPNELTNRLTALHVAFAEVDRGAIQDTYSEVLQIGKATATEQQAQDLVQRLKDRMSQIHREAQGQLHPSVVMVIGRTPGALTNLVVVGRDSFLDELVETAGGKNLISAESNSAYPRVSLETLLRLNPDVIIDMGDMGTSSEERQKKVEANQALWREASYLKAVQKGRVYCISSTAFVVPGPRAIEAAAELFALLQGHQPQ
jgi:iron complex transport system substrate-binding protein